MYRIKTLLIGVVATLAPCRLRFNVGSGASAIYEG